MNNPAENQQLSLAQRLSPHLFWDIDVDQFDPEQNAGQIIQRVLEYGELSDWRTIRDHYTLGRVVQECQKLRSLQPQVFSFICAISNTHIEDYRCYHIRQSNPTPWNS